MNPNRRKLKVHIGHLKATVYRWTHPASGKKAWRFAYRDGARWKYITRATQGETEHMLHKHYHNPKTREEGEAWFSLDPAACSDLFRFLQNGDGNFRANLHIFSPQIGKNSLKVALGDVFY